MKKRIVSFFLVIFGLIFLLNSCKNSTLIKPNPVGFTALGSNNITTTSAFGYGYKINTLLLTIPSSAMTTNYIALRNGISFRDSIFSDKSGTILSEVPINLLKLICFDNKKHNEINSTSDVVQGWKIENADFLASNGSTSSITNLLDSTTAKSLSYTVCYFPDGVYKIFNHIDQNLNQTGFFQPFIENNLLKGIIYKPVYIGISNIEFQNHPSFSANPLGYGIWGVTDSKFYPIYSINRNSDAILTLSKITF